MKLNDIFIRQVPRLSENAKRTSDEISILQYEDSDINTLQNQRAARRRRFENNDAEREPSSGLNENSSRATSRAATPSEMYRGWSAPPQVPSFENEDSDDGGHPLGAPAASSPIRGRPQPSQSINNRSTIQGTLHHHGAAPSSSPPPPNQGRSATTGRAIATVCPLTKHRLWGRV